MQVKANGLVFEVETFGFDRDPAALLIMGLGAQLTRWPVAFCKALEARGFYVIRYDNRDVGLSTKLHEASAPDMAAIFSGTAAPAYGLEDMATDAAQILDSLGVEKAHIIGASMGGMIAQLVAADHPDKTLSLTSIMSTTGNPALPPATPEAMAALTVRPPAEADLDALVDHAVRTQKAIGSPAHDYGAPEARALLRVELERSLYPEGFARQLAAIVANGDRREKLKTIAAPTAVIHGEVDLLVHPEAGRDTAGAIAGAELVIIPGMGHDLPPFVIDQVADIIARTAARATPA
jgi:pimeloyl-ACP methyl ester carboxylesterase